MLDYVLDYMLDHIIIGLLITELQYCFYCEIKTNFKIYIKDYKCDICKAPKKLWFYQQFKSKKI